MIDAEIDVLLGDTHQVMTRVGGATRVDASGDRRVERVEAGDWFGRVEMNGTDHPMTGTFQG